jgi:hypothetical protein
MEMDMGYHMTKEQRQEMWTAAHIKTVHKLRALGLWPDKVPISALMAAEQTSD